MTIRVVSVPQGAVPVPQELVFAQVSKTEAWEFPQCPLWEWSSIAKPVSHARPIA
jgi:hypothetical protein